ncbi:MAG: FAD-binding protein, partial [Polyangiaceae bacterium]
MQVTTDYLVLGSGIAGLTFALRAAEFGEVTIVTKRESEDSATNWAQGGMAAVLSPDDSFEKHAEDTRFAGAGMCHDVVVDLCVREAPESIRWLSDMGAQFSRSKSGEFDLGREAAHTERRIVHAGDITGREIQRALLEAARQSPNIRILEWHMGVDLITMSKFGGPDQCVGAYILDEKSGTVLTVLARATVLATGGAGKVYLYTSNPDVASGDGVAMAY